MSLAHEMRSLSAILFFLKTRIAAARVLLREDVRAANTLIGGKSGCVGRPNGESADKQYFSMYFATKSGFYPK